MLIQTGITELAIKRLNKGILGRFTGLDEVQFDSGTPGPEKHCLKGQLRSIVQNNCARQGADPCQLLKFKNQSLATD